MVKVFVGSLALVMVMGATGAHAMTIADVVQQLHIYMNNAAALTASSDTSLANTTMPPHGATSTPAALPSEAPTVLLEGLTYAEGSSMIVNKTLQSGSKGDVVKALQLFLIAKGYLHADATGNFGPLTVAALKQFQSDNGISGGDGTIVGPRTRTAIAAQVQQSLSTTTPSPSSVQ